MRSVSVISNQKFNLLIVLLSVISVTVSAQENSAYSRYGLGNIVPSGSVSSRGMGGLSAAYVDYDKRFDRKDAYVRWQAINFLNPASYAKNRITSFDLGVEVDSRTLHDSLDPKKFKSTSAIISYVQLAVPLNRKKSFGLNLGLRPLTRISYKIESRQRDADPVTGSPIDSVVNLYEGTGGSYQAFVGLGKSFKNLSIGFNTGYYFGTKDYSTRKVFVPDSIDKSYYNSNHETKASFGGVFLDFGMQYHAQLNKKTILSLGAYGNFAQKFNATREVLSQTISYDANGAIFNIDTVSYNNNKGKLQYPSTLAFGFMLDRIDQWQLGVDFSTTSWDNYSFFGEKEALKNSWLVKVGGQFMPDPYDPKSYWSHVTYRAGIQFGPDYVYLGRNLQQFGISLGAGLPIRPTQFSNQYTSINIALEYGKRGNQNNQLRENIFRIALGFTLSDIWFIKKKYY